MDRALHVMTQEAPLCQEENPREMTQVKCVYGCLGLFSTCLLIILPGGLEHFFHFTVDGQDNYFWKNS